MAKLTLHLGSTVLNEITLTKDITTIGRSNDNDIMLDNLSASGHHARVVKKNSGYTLEDLASTNGTLINGQKVTTKILEDDDVIAIGKHELRFLAESGERIEKTSDFEKTVFVRMPSPAAAAPIVAPPATPSLASPEHSAAAPAVKNGGIVKIVTVVVAVLAVAVVAYLALKMK